MISKKLYVVLMMKNKEIKILFFIVKVLAESEQMRKEADDTGPVAELEHWRQRRAKFNTLLDQMKSFDCKTVIAILMHAKSKVLKV